MNVQPFGALCFGLVIGWVLRLVLFQAKEIKIGSLGTIISAVGGAAITSLFDQTGIHSPATRSGWPSGSLRMYSCATSIQSPVVSSTGKENELILRPVHLCGLSDTDACCVKRRSTPMLSVCFSTHRPAGIGSEPPMG